MSDSKSVGNRFQPPQDASVELSRHRSNEVQIQKDITPSRSSDTIRTTSKQYAESPYGTEKEDNNMQPEGALSPCNSIHGTISKKLISWEPNDKENPYNWSDVRIA
jgi:hypothetical protein